MADEWTLLENLLLVQAVYKYGEDSWLEIATKLSRHSLLKRNADFFNQQSCSLQYDWLLHNIDFEISQDTPAVVRIAEKLYMQRVNEITQAIKKDENDFQQLVNEIDSIRSGEWDEKLTTTSQSNDSSSNNIYPSNSQIDDCLMKEYLKEDDIDTDQSPNRQNEQETESCKIEEPLSNNMHIDDQNELSKDEEDSNNHLDATIQDNSIQPSDMILTPQGEEEKQEEQEPQLEPVLNNHIEQETSVLGNSDNENESGLDKPMTENEETPFEAKEVDATHSEDQSQLHIQTHTTPISEPDEENNNHIVDAPMLNSETENQGDSSLEKVNQSQDTSSHSLDGTEESKTTVHETPEPMLENSSNSKNEDAAVSESDDASKMEDTETNTKAKSDNESDNESDMVMDLTSEPKNSDDKTELPIIINEPQTESASLAEDQHPEPILDSSPGAAALENIMNDVLSEEVKETTTTEPHQEIKEDAETDKTPKMADESVHLQHTSPESEQNNLNDTITEMTKEASPEVITEAEPVANTDMTSEPTKDNQQDAVDNPTPEAIINEANLISKDEVKPESANETMNIKKAEVEVTEGLEQSVVDELKSGITEGAEEQMLEEPHVMEETTKEEPSNTTEQTESQAIAEPEVPEVVQPEVVQPEVVQPEMVQPEMVQPEVVQPEVVQPVVVQPEVVQPEVVEEEGTPEMTEQTEQTVLEATEMANMAEKPEIEATGNAELEVTQKMTDPESLKEAESNVSIEPEVTKEPEVANELEPIVSKDPVIAKEIDPEVVQKANPEDGKENQPETSKEHEIDIEGDTVNDPITEIAEEPDIITVESMTESNIKDETVAERASEEEAIIESKQETASEEVKQDYEDIPEPIVADDELAEKDPTNGTQDSDTNNNLKRPIDTALDIKDEHTSKRSRLESESPAMSNSSPHPSATDDDMNGSTVSTPAQTRHGNKDDIRQKTWQKTIILLWQEIANHKNGTMFMNPIKKSNAPLYYRVVKQPLDLKSIKNRVRDGIVKTTAEFERDIILMLTNSLMYNKEGTEIYQMAFEMLEDVQEQIRLFKSADKFEAE